MAIDFMGTAASMLGGGSGIISALVGPIGLTVVLGLAVLGIAYLVLEQKKYNKIVSVKRLYRGNQGKYYHDKAKLYTDSNGVQWWKLKGLKKQLTVPPEEALGITAKGQTIAFGALDSNGQWTWLEDTFDFEKYKDDAKLGKSAYKPISTESKANYAYQQHYNKALRNDWWKENAHIVVAGTALVMLVGMFLMFAPKVIEATEGLASTNAGVAAQQAETTKQMNTLLENINYMMSQEGISAPPSAVEAPN